MRTRLIITSILSLFTYASMAQSIENDDMYFNSKDRAKLRAQKSSEITYASVKSKKANDSKEIQNPTDTYSARNINPEFAARSNAQSAQFDNEDYFVSNYRYNTATNLNNWNNNFNNWYGSSWYRPNYFGPSINRWNSPYYGFNDPYYSPWYDPYWNYNGWSASFSYYWGNSWNYGWGGNYNYWNRPYCGYASAWGPSWGWGSGWYGYPRTVVVVNNYEGGRNVSYGKRPSRSTIMSTQNNETRNRSSYSSTVTRDNSGGRVANRQDEYYNRSWKYTPPANNNSSSGSWSNGSTNVRSRYNTSSTNSNTSYDRSNSSSYSPGRSGSSSSSGVRTQSSSSGSGSNGRTRGRD